MESSTGPSPWQPALSRDQLWDYTLLEMFVSAYRAGDYDRLDAFVRHYMETDRDHPHQARRALNGLQYETAIWLALRPSTRMN